MHSRDHALVAVVERSPEASVTGSARPVFFEEAATVELYDTANVVKSAAAQLRGSRDGRKGFCSSTWRVTCMSGRARIEARGPGLMRLPASASWQTRGVFTR